MSKKSLNNIETDKNHQNITVSKRRKIKQIYQKPSGTKIYNLHHFVKRSKGNFSKLHSKKSFSKTGNILFISFYLSNDCFVN